jgi:hypothetical protein
MQRWVGMASGIEETGLIDLPAKFSATIMPGKLGRNGGMMIYYYIQIGWGCINTGKAIVPACGQQNAVLTKPENGNILHHSHETRSTHDLKNAGYHERIT